MDSPCALQRVYRDAAGDFKFLKKTAMLDICWILSEDLIFDDALSLLMMGYVAKLGFWQLLR